MRLRFLMLLTVMLPGHALADDMLSLDGAVPTLTQDFKEAPQWRKGAVEAPARPMPLSDPYFSWAAGYIYGRRAVGVPAPGFPAWTSNSNADADPNGDMIAQIGPERSPLAWERGKLDFIARPMPGDLEKTIGPVDPHGYMSASISSFPFAQRYGEFAISAKLPKGKGIWPAFWLLPADRSWPPEIDIFEMLGKDTHTFYTTVHMRGPDGKHAKEYKVNAVEVDLSEDFHEYALDWGPDNLRWYFDRKLVFSQPTPPQLRIPCYIIANLAVGKPKDWGGAPDATTPFPAVMQVAYIRAWQRMQYP